MSNLFAVASGWETISDEDRIPLRSLITKIVGYQCKLSCQPNHGSVDIYVFSVKAKCITDWIEIQPSGALGVLFDQYPMEKSPTAVSDACEDYNEELGVEYESESDEEEAEDTGDAGDAGDGVKHYD
jgi:hypothetical protein